MLIFTLYFGQAIAGRGDVTEGEWRRFQDDTISVNLPNGYTLSDGVGAWMNPVTHQTVHEATRVLTVAMPADPASVATINQVRKAYQDRFHQQLVGMTTQQGCGVF
jgi:hypothetical protein